VNERTFVQAFTFARRLAGVRGFEDRRMWKWLKNLALFRAVAIGASAAMWAIAWSVRPELSQRPLPYTPEQIAIERERYRRA